MATGGDRRGRALSRNGAGTVISRIGRTSLATGSGVLVLAAALVTAAAPAASASAAPAALPPITHPDADSLGSTIRLHEPVSASAPQTTRRVTALATTTTTAPPYGMDVSNYQGNVDWATAKRNGAAFVYIKATESTTYQNGYFSQQYNGSYAAGILRGAYHFALPDRSSGATQATYFLAHGGGWSADGKTLPPMLDIEYNPYGATCYGKTPAQLVSWIRDFSNTIHARTGRYPIIYTGRYYWNQCTGSNATFGATNPLFIAAYQSTVPPMPAGWAYHTIWQYNDHGVFPGDADVFNGTMAQLQTFAKGSASATPPPAPSHPVAADPITTYYNKLGGASRLGTAKAAAYSVAGGQARDFQNGSIFYSATTGTHWVHGAILNRYRAMGGPAGPLSFPLTDELPVPGGSGRYNIFAGIGRSSIYWSKATGAHSVSGAIRAHWGALGGPTGFLGYPISEEGPATATGGRVSQFRGGTMVWTKATGAHEVHGQIRVRWQSLSGASGVMGFPTSDEFSVPGGRKNTFTKGSITWLARTHLTYLSMLG